jgi:hypothetical protein
VIGDSAESPSPYRVVYSGRVQDELRKLAEAAKAAGQGQRFVAALKEIDWRLHIYPQFGQPLYDLQRKPLRVWVGVVPPLVVRYVLNEAQRVVTVTEPMVLLPRSGFG